MREFEIDCPECRGWIRLDLETGQVLDHGRAGESRESESKPKQLDEAFERVRKRQEQGEETFRAAVRQVESHSKKLDQAFEAARKKAEENPAERPHNPLDDQFR